MLNEINMAVMQAHDRYLQFLHVLRSQVDVALRDGAHNAQVRNSALAQCRSFARSYLDTEAAMLEQITARIADLSARKINEETGTQHFGVDFTIAEYVTEATDYLTDILAAQVQRDIATVYRTIQQLGLRMDIYLRSGGYSVSAARMKIATEEDRRTQFTFLDRAGRKYKSTKHLRDTVRLHLINVRNEVAVYTAAENAKNTAFIVHDDPSYRHFGTEFALIGENNALPLYSEIRSDIFHPGSDAWISTRRP